MSWEQLDYDAGEIRNLHYGLIHKGLSTIVNIEECRLPFVKESNTPKNYTLCKDGDIAFADASEDTNDVAKAVEFVNCDGKKIICGLHTIHGRDRLNITNIGYKAFAFSSPKFSVQINRIAQGTKVFSICARNFSELFIGIPSLDEQKKIVSFLSLIDERISTQNKIIEKYESLIQAIIYQKKTDGIHNGNWQKMELSKVLQERSEKNINGHVVCSVSVSQGVVNQIEHLGRSFAAKETSHYNVVKYGDIVYTKSPTGDFPYGIVKCSYIKDGVAVSPLYGVYMPVNDYIGVILHFYFMQPSNTFNYLHPLIQKGAKNTINITNGRFLENTIPLPKTEDEALSIANALKTIQRKIDTEKGLLQSYEKKKEYLLRQMFI